MNSRKTLIPFLIIAMLAFMGCRNQDGQVHGAAAGAGLGAVTGLALGALVGEAGLGAATGAIAGAASGAAYEYDQSRQERRNREVVTAVSGNQQGQQAAPQETVAQSGTRHLEDFLGNWNVSAWAQKGDGTKISGGGTAKVVMESKEVASMMFDDIKAEGVDGVFDGKAVLSYSNGGFRLECSSTAYEGTRQYVGEYLPASNTYNFFPVQAGNETGATGVIRSNVKIVIKPAGNLISIDTFSMIDGKETQIQSYRFTK